MRLPMELLGLLAKPSEEFSAAGNELLLDALGPYVTAEHRAVAAAAVSKLGTLREGMGGRRGSGDSDEESAATAQKIDLA